MDAEDVVAVLLDVVFYGEGDVSVDVDLSLERRVGMRWRRVLPDYSGVDELERH